LGLLAVRQVGSLDIGFHLKAGEFILERHDWPRTDPFTYTLHDHLYIDTSWGYQVLVAAVHRLGGARGIVLFHAAVVLAVFLLLYRTARLRPVDPSLLVVLFLVGGLACEVRFEARPEVLSWLLLAAVLHVLERRACGLAAPLWLLPLLHLAWANLHSLFVLGWIAMAAYLFGAAGADRRPDRPLLRWALLSLVAPIINPYGWRGLVFPFTLATRLDLQNAFGQSIGEFVSPFALDFSDQFPFVPWAPLVAFWCFAALSAMAVLRSPRGRRLHAWLLWLPFTYLAAKMMRNMPLLVVATLPLAAGGLAPASGAAARRGRTPAGLRAWGPLGDRVRRTALAFSAAASLVLGLRVVNDAYYIATRRAERFGWGWNRLALPVDAACFAVEAGLGGPVLNHLNFGGYLMWTLPEPVFIDGRLEVVGEEFYEAYRAALSSPERLEAQVTRYGIRWLIFPYAINARLLGQVSGDARWRLAYFDHLAAIFVRADPNSGGHLDPLEANPQAPVDIAALPGLGFTARPGRVDRWLDGLIHRQTFPADAYNRGLFHLFRNELPRAVASFVGATAESGGLYYETYNNLGAALYRQGRIGEAQACYRVVLDERPDNPIARERARSAPPSPQR
jgi:tetratricopeptide (TPR) repeat protein